MKVIALADPYFSGHHPMYLKIYSRLLLEAGYKVIVYCANPEKIENWIGLNCQDKINNFYSYKIYEPGDINFNLKFPGEYARIISTASGQLIMTVKRWLIISSSIRQSLKNIKKSPDLVFILWLDSYLGHRLLPLPFYLLDYIFPYKWSGLYFHPTYFRCPEKRFLAKIMSFLDKISVVFSKNCRAITVLDRGIAPKMEEQFGKPVISFPDITDGVSLDKDYFIVKKIKEHASGRKIIGIIGSLEKRKGILTLLHVARAAINENWFFVFAGELQKDKNFSLQELNEIKITEEEKPGNCFFYFDFISDQAKFNALIDVCDILYCAYINFPHSSNMITKAAVFEKPLLVSKGFYMEEVVREFSLGAIVEDGDIDGCIKKLKKLCDEIDNGSFKKKANFIKYRDMNSYTKLICSFEKVLECYV